MADEAAQTSDTSLLLKVVTLWPPYQSTQESSSREQDRVLPQKVETTPLIGEETSNPSAASEATAAETAAPATNAQRATHHDISHVYGEVVVESFHEFLRSNQWFGSEDAPATFVDLGSGAGACIAAAMASGRFARCIGVELEEDWFQCSAERFRALQEVAPAAEAAAAAADLAPGSPWSVFNFELSESAHPACSVSIRQGSMFDSDWVSYACSERKPTVVFCNATALNIPQMQQLAQVCEKLPAGSIVLTTTAALPSRLFDARKLEDRLPMSWGSTSKVHLAVRKKIGKWAARMLPRF